MGKGSSSTNRQAVSFAAPLSKETFTPALPVVTEKEALVLHAGRELYDLGAIRITAPRVLWIKEAASLTEAASRGILVSLDRKGLLNRNGYGKLASWELSPLGKQFLQMD
jgi:hypothetical protein